MQLMGGFDDYRNQDCSQVIHNLAIKKLQYVHKLEKGASPAVDAPAK